MHRCHLCGRRGSLAGPTEAASPVGPGEPGGERGLELAVEPLYHSIGLWMVGSCLPQLDAQELGDFGP